MDTGGRRQAGYLIPQKLMTWENAEHANRHLYLSTIFHIHASSSRFPPCVSGQGQKTQGRQRDAQGPSLSCTHADQEWLLVLYVALTQAAVDQVTGKPDVINTSLTQGAHIHTYPYTDTRVERDVSS